MASIRFDSTIPALRKFPTKKGDFREVWLGIDNPVRRVFFEFTCEVDLQSLFGILQPSISSAKMSPHIDSFFLIPRRF